MLHHTTLFWQLHLAHIAKESPDLLRHSSVVGLRSFWMAVELGLDQEQSKLALIAGSLHDIGKIPSLNTSGFHPLDGADYVAGYEETTLASLIAHHTGARYEAALLGLTITYAEERSPVADILAICDLTTDQDGRVVSVRDRLADIEARYGAESHHVLALNAYAEDFSAAYDRVHTLRRHRRILNDTQATFPI